MEYSIESEFMNSICSYGSDKASVYLAEKSEKTYLDLQIEKEKVSSVKVGSGEPLADATYVESPLYIHMLDTLLQADTFREAEGRFRRRSMLPIHIKDLAEKIDGLRMASDSLQYFEPLSINDIIKCIYILKCLHKVINWLCNNLFQFFMSIDSK